MGYDISLTQGMRANLISLQLTSKLVTATQNRLSTGKRVNTAMDDPVNFFAAQTHLNRAMDLAARKDGIGEGIQTMKAANNGITTINKMLESAKGIITAALSTSDQTLRTAYAEQFDEILSQIDTIAADSGYKGTNLLQNESLTINFAEVSGQSFLTINGTDVTSAAQGVEKTIIPAGTPQTDKAMGTGHEVAYVLSTATFIYTGPTVNPGGSITITDIDISGTPDATATVWSDVPGGAYGMLFDVTTSSGRSINSSDGGMVTGDSKSISVTIANVWPLTFTTGDTLRVDLGGPMVPSVLQRTFGTDYTAAELSNIKVGGVLQVAGTDYNLVTRSGDGKADIIFTSGHGPADGAGITADVTIGSDINAWETDSGINTSLSQVNAAMETLRTTSKGISSSSNILATRLDFIKAIIDTLKTGADNLTLADMNEESANMLMLGTRQSLGMTSLSIASQAAQAVLRLFE